jgi:hypothetical protein
MPMHTTWSDWFANHEINDAGNRNFQTFSNSLSLVALDAEKLQSLVKEICTVILAADVSRNIMILHSPNNFGGTRCWKLFQNQEGQYQQIVAEYLVGGFMI